MSWRDEEPRPEPEDWFEEPEHDWVEPVARGDRPFEDEPGPFADVNRRLVLAGLAVLVALVLVGWGIARIVGGDEEQPAAPTQPAPTEPAAPTEPPATQPDPGAAITLPEDVTLRVGDEGENVEVLQRALTQLGYDLGEADGSFGAQTADAVRAFQTDAELSADGIAGPETLAAINQALAEAPG